MSAIILNMALQEAQHVFIKNGLFYFKNNNFNLEIGLVLAECIYYFFEGTKMNQSIDYVGVEAYPISAEELVSMNC
jgi:hypothetical protein